MAIVAKTNEPFVKQVVDSRRQHKPIVFVQSFSICIAVGPGLYVTGNQETWIRNACDPTNWLLLKNSVSKRTLTTTRLAQSDFLSLEQVIPRTEFSFNSRRNNFDQIIVLESSSKVTSSAKIFM